MMKTNFDFLKEINQLPNEISSYAIRAEQLYYFDYIASAAMLRTVGEQIVKYMLKEQNIDVNMTFEEMIRLLLDSQQLTNSESDTLHLIRKIGNRAVHADRPVTQKEVEEALKHTHVFLTSFVVKKRFVNESTHIKKFVLSKTTNFIQEQIRQNAINAQDIIKQFHQLKSEHNTIIDNFNQSEIEKERLQNQLEQSEKQISELKQEKNKLADKLEQEIHDKNERISLAKQEIQEIQNSHLSQEQKLQQMEVARTAAKEKEKEFQKVIDSLQASQAQVSLELHTATKQITSIKQEKLKVEEQSNQLQQQIKQNESQLELAFNEIQELKNREEQFKQDLENAKREVEETKKQIEIEKENLRQSKEAAEVKMKQELAEQEVAKTQAEKAKAEAAKADAEQRAAEAMKAQAIAQQREAEAKEAQNKAIITTNQAIASEAEKAASLAKQQTAEEIRIAAQKEREKIEAEAKIKKSKAAQTHFEELKDFDEAEQAYHQTNYTRAIHLYSKMATRKHHPQESREAQYRLGVMYLRGLGTDRDFKKAIMNFHDAAEQGHADAQCNLGWLYAQGIGTSKDKKKALVWYGKAAWQGHEQAKENLEILKNELQNSFLARCKQHQSKIFIAIIAIFGFSFWQYPKPVASDNTQASSAKQAIEVLEKKVNALMQQQNKAEEVTVVAQKIKESPEVKKDVVKENKLSEKPQVNSSLAHVNNQSNQTVEFAMNELNAVLTNFGNGDVYQYHIRKNQELWLKETMQKCQNIDKSMEQNCQVQSIQIRTQYFRDNLDNINKLSSDYQNLLDLLAIRVNKLTEKHAKRHTKYISNYQQWAKQRKQICDKKLLPTESLECKINMSKERLNHINQYLDKNNIKI